MSDCHLLDTGSAGDLMNRHGATPSRFLEAAPRGARVGIAVPVLGELWPGIELSVSRDANVTRRRRMLAELTIWPFDVAAAQEFGRLFALLRRAGRPMPQVDIQIAAVALTLGRCTVVTRDGDFAAIPGLRLADRSV